MKYQKGQFTLVPNKETLRGMSCQAQVVFFWLCDYADNDTGECYPSRKRIAIDAGVSLRSVDKALKELEEANLVKKTQRTVNNEKQSNLYEVLIAEQEMPTTIATFAQPSAGAALPSAPRAQPSAGAAHRTKLNNYTYLTNNIKVETQNVYDLFIEKFAKNPNTYKLTDKRKAKIRQRLKDAGFDMLSKAINNVADSPFHNGDNERGWTADLDFIVRNYEQVERLSQLDNKKETVEYKADWYYEKD